VEQESPLSLPHPGQREEASSDQPAHGNRIGNASKSGGIEAGSVNGCLSVPAKAALSLHCHSSKSVPAELKLFAMIAGGLRILSLASMSMVTPLIPVLTIFMGPIEVAHICHQIESINNGIQLFREVPPTVSYEQNPVLD
jgi:hypothetical protein